MLPYADLIREFLPVVESINTKSNCSLVTGLRTSCAAQQIALGFVFMSSILSCRTNLYSTIGLQLHISWDFSVIRTSLILHSYLNLSIELSLCHVNSLNYDNMQGEIHALFFLVVLSFMN